MNIITLIETVRQNVIKARSDRWKEYVQDRIEWSRKSSQTSRLNRWAWSLPDCEYTVEEAVLSYNKFGDTLEGIVNWTGLDAMRICNALETAKFAGLPLKLTVAEVAELRKWL